MTNGSSAPVNGSAALSVQLTKYKIVTNAADVYISSDKLYSAVPKPLLGIIVELLVFAFGGNYQLE